MVEKFEIEVPFVRTDDKHPRRLTSFFPTKPLKTLRRKSASQFHPRLRKRIMNEA